MSQMLCVQCTERLVEQHIIGLPDANKSTTDLGGGAGNTCMACCGLFSTKNPCYDPDSDFAKLVVSFSSCVLTKNLLMSRFGNSIDIEQHVRTIISHVLLDNAII